jgi:hypothetical protein
MNFAAASADEVVNLQCIKPDPSCQHSQGERRLPIRKLVHMYALLYLIFKKRVFCKTFWKYFKELSTYLHFNNKECQRCRRACP